MAKSLPKVLGCSVNMQDENITVIIRREEGIHEKITFQHEGEVKNTSIKNDKYLIELAKISPYFYGTSK